MSIFSKIGHAIKSIGHDIAKVGKGFAHAVEGVGKHLVHDVEAVAKQTLNMTNDLIHGRIQKALHDAVNVGEVAFKGLRDLNTAVLDIGTETLKNAHLSKSLDKALAKVDKARNFVDDITDRTVHSIGDSVNGVTDGTIGAAKAAAKGHLGKALTEFTSAGASALNLAANLTPEGLAATAAVATLQKTHLGGPVVDSVVEGALTGGRKSLTSALAKATKEGVKAEVGQKVGEKLQAVSDNGTGMVALAALEGAAGATGSGGSGRSRRGGAHENGHAPASYTHAQTRPASDEPPNRRADGRKHDVEVDSGQNNGTNRSNGQNGAGAQAYGDVQAELAMMQWQARQNARMQMLAALSKTGDDDDEPKPAVPKPSTPSTMALTPKAA